jgi:hypothetical protein
MQSPNYMLDSKTGWKYYCWIDIKTQCHARLTRFHIEISFGMHVFILKELNAAY